MEGRQPPRHRWIAARRGPRAPGGTGRPRAARGSPADHRRRTWRPAGVRFAHPLHAEAVRQELGLLAARQLRRDLADVLQSTGDETDDNVLRVGDPAHRGRRVIADGAADPRHQSGAPPARPGARRTPGQGHGGPGPDDRQRPCRRQHLVGTRPSRRSGACARDPRVDWSAASPSEQAAIAGVSASVLFWGLGEASEALARLHAAATVAPTSSAPHPRRRGCHRGRAWPAGRGARHRSAGQSRRENSARLVCRGHRAHVRRPANDRHRRHGPRRPPKPADRGSSPGWPTASRSWMPVGSPRRASSPSSGSMPPRGRQPSLPLLLDHRARQRRDDAGPDRGRAAAVRGGCSALVRSARRDYLRRWALSGAMFGAALLGDLDDAAEQSRSLDSSPAHEAVVHEHPRQLAEQWIVAQRGDPAGAARALRSMADDADQAGRYGDVVRRCSTPRTIGDARPAAAWLEHHDLDVDGGLFPAVIDWIIALDRRDDDALAAIAERSLLEADVSVLAAEAASSSWTIARERGAPERLVAARGRRAQELRAMFGPGLTPSLAVTPIDLPLSGREREIATLVASGRTSRGGCRGARHRRQDGREPPRPHLRQARHPLQGGAGERGRTGGGADMTAGSGTDRRLL